MTGNFALGPEAVLAGYALRHIKTTPSTNRLAFEYLAKLPDDKSNNGRNFELGDKTAVWFVADHQTEGRGRLGRAWLSDKGNLAASLLLLLPERILLPQILSFVAAIALADAIDMVVDKGAKERVELKWPNDLLFMGGKLAGILIEAKVFGDGSCAIVIGFGVNVKKPPEGIAYPVSAICQSGIDVTPQSLFGCLSDCWHEKFSLWDYGRGTKEVLSQWRNKAFGFGKPVEANQSGKVMSGIFSDIDDTGRLVLLLGNGEKIFVSAGDIGFET